MKFKVGDRVRVVKIVSNHSKDKYLGKILTIKSLNPNGDYAYPVPHYGIEEEEVRFVFFETELELFEFTKADLEDGMIVEYANGERRMVLGDYIIAGQIGKELKYYNEYLEDAGASHQTINKVYKTTAHFLEDIFDDNHLTLIWERPEEPAKKMTVAEIEKELGYKVEIVSEDN